MHASRYSLIWWMLRRGCITWMSNSLCFTLPNLRSLPMVPHNSLTTCWWPCTGWIVKAQSVTQCTAMNTRAHPLFGDPSKKRSLWGYILPTTIKQKAPLANLLHITLLGWAMLHLLPVMFLPRTLCASPPSPIVLRGRHYSALQSCFLFSWAWLAQQTMDSLCPMCFLFFFPTGGTYLY